MTFRSGGIVDADGRYPAMGWPVGPASRTVHAPFLPESPVEPQELVDYLESKSLAGRPIERALPPIMERTVRIPASQREEALGLLRPLVERSTPEEIERIVPALRWLARTSSPGGDPLAWRAWLRGRGEQRLEPVRGSRPPTAALRRSSRRRAATIA